jgi:hypothetical protein
VEDESELLCATRMGESSLRRIVLTNAKAFSDTRRR